MTKAEAKKMLKAKLECLKAQEIKEMIDEILGGKEE